MGSETELKLAIAPRHASRIGHLPWLRGIRSHDVLMGNTYYDTPDGELSRRAIALRHRVIGKKWLITVKAKTGSSGGLAVRQEWEYPCAPHELNFSGVTNEATRGFLEGLREQLKAVFSTNFKRRAWLYSPHPALEVEVALDRGDIIADQRSAPLCEVELELKSGRPEALLDLALDLSSRIPVLPENRSKAERGQQLARRLPYQATAAGFSPIKPDMKTAEAFSALAHHCVDHFLANAEGVRSTDDPEFIHQSRVAIRRLRALLKLFRPILPTAFHERWLPEWRELATALGNARDLDVLLNETLPEIEQAYQGHDGLEQFIGYAAQQRDAARESARSHFQGTRPGQVVLGFLIELERLQLHGADKLEAYAEKRLHRLQRTVRKGCKKAATSSIEELHSLRIRFKRLRYALEFFTPLLPKHRTEKHLAAVKAMQDALGRINDLERALSIDAQAPDSVRCALVEGWLGARQLAAKDALGPAIREFLDLTPAE